MPEGETDEFELISAGRVGSVIYRQGHRRIELGWERSGVRELDILLNRVDLRYWDEPKGEPISMHDQIEILYKLRSWLKEQGIRSDVDLPEKVELENRPCIRAGCDGPRVKGFVYCRRHYDENLLVLEGIPKAEMQERMRASIADMKGKSDGEQ